MVQVRRTVLASVGTLVAAVAMAAPATAIEPERRNFDTRPGAGATPPAAVMDAREELREELGRDAMLATDARTGAVRSVARLEGFLTGPSARDGAEVALDYLREHEDAFALGAAEVDELELVDRVRKGGVEHLSWSQSHRGVPSADTMLTAAVTGAGRLIGITGPALADISVGSIEPTVSAAQAYAAASASGGGPAAAPSIAGRAGGAEQATRFADGGRAALTIYRDEDVSRLGWRVLAPVSSTGIFDVLVDARSRAVVRRVNRVNFAVAASVFEYSPAQSGQVTRQLDPWLTPPGAVLDGPNAHAFSDRDDTTPFLPAGDWNLEPTDPEVTASAGGFEFPATAFPGAPTDNCPGSASGITTDPGTTCTWDPDTPGSWQANDSRERSATQLFYLVNAFHDHLRDDPDIAFGGAEGAFERTVEPIIDPNVQDTIDDSASDPVLAQTLDGASTGPDREHRNNANFATLPDGFPGLLQMYLWHPHGTAFGAYDGSDDASIVYHEYAHGLSNRLVTDASGYGALGGAQAGAMGEGWSDFYALDLLVEQGLETDSAGPGDVRIGHYLDHGTAAALRYQSIDCAPGDPGGATGDPCPDSKVSDPDGSPVGSGPGGFDYGDFGRIHEQPEVHADGEIWAQTLWSLRARLGDEHGVLAGAARARRYITLALRMSPPEPSFLDMRNAILVASQEDDAILWEVFAERGMGYFATTTDGDDTTPVADFTDPADLSGATAALGGAVHDEDDAPVAGTTVAIAGHEPLGPGVGDDLSATTGADGRYSIAGVPTTPTGVSYTLLARRPGFATATSAGFTAAAGASVERSFLLRRDWSSPSGGASLVPLDTSTGGCGRSRLIDDRQATAWSSPNPGGGARPQVVVDLGRQVDIARVTIDPTAGCGDDPSASLGRFELRGATTAGSYASLAGGTFGPAHLGRYNDAYVGFAPGIRYLMLRLLSPQSTGGDGAGYVDVSELQVFRAPAARAATGAASAVHQTGATVAGEVDPRGIATSYLFEYGPTAGYGSSTAAVDAGSGSAPAPAAAVLGSLTPGTTYHYRVVAARGPARVAGADRTFTTPPAGGGPNPLAPSGPSPLAPPGPTTAPREPAAAVASASVTSRRLAVDRRGRFRVRIAYAAAARPGSARLTVTGPRRRRYASARTRVSRGRVRTVRIELNRAGRRMLRPGRTLKVKLRLTLPDGEVIVESITLKRPPLTARGGRQRPTTGDFSPPAASAPSSRAAA